MRDSARHSGRATLPAEQWALALAAMYPIVNLEGRVAFAEISFGGLDTMKHLHGAADARQMLKRGWQVGSVFPSKRRRLAIRTLDWLAFEGHRAPFQYERDGISESELSYLAWDLARLSYVAQISHAAGYIDAADAWSYASAAALLAQPAFASWQHFGACYLQSRR